MRTSPAKARLAIWLCAIAVGLVSLGATWSLIQNHGSDVPFWDQWQAEGRVILIPAGHGTLDASAFWLHHNEHRIVLTKLINLGLAVVNRQWDPLLEMSVNALIHAAIATVLLLVAGPWLTRRTLLPASVVVALAFALPFSWENSLDGFQSQFYLLELSALASIWTLAGAKPLGARWWLGFGFSVVGLGTMASGLAAPASVLVIEVGTTVLARSRPSGKTVASWTLLASVFLAGVASVHRVPAHATLEASNPAEWLHAALHALAWPSNRFALTALLVQAPAMLLLAGCIRRRWVESHEAVLLGLSLWALLQVALLAYGRGHGTSIDASRYFDLLAFGVCVNVLALAALWKPKPVAWSALALAWLAVVGTGLATQSRYAMRELDGPIARRNAMERSHVRAAVLANDPGPIYRAPVDELPFPNPAYLVQVLTDPAIHVLLPLGIRAPIALMPEGSAQGFQLSRTSALPGAPDTPFWTAVRGPARFVSRSLPASCLPVLHFQLAGSRNLLPTALWLEGADGRRVSPKIGDFAGNRWQTANLRIPSIGPVRLHASIPAGAWLAFSEPTEFGLYSWYAYSARKFGGLLAALGGVLFALGMIAMPGRAAAAAAQPTPAHRFAPATSRSRRQNMA